MNEASILFSNFSENTPNIKTLLSKNCILYFPPNRFEEPGWLNYDNLINRADYRFLKNITNYSNRRIINYAPMKDNRNWLLDIIFDRAALEINTSNFSINNQGNLIQLPLFLGFQGESNTIYNEIIKFLKLLFNTSEDLRLGVGKRRARTIEIVKNERRWIPNIFNLSTGESILLNIFLTIVKDFDLTTANITTLNDIRGIVIIDEADIHLHTHHQYIVLPSLLKLFPHVQFIITSHSPLFLLGLKNEIGEDGFEIINLPSGEEINIESFSEFEKAYTYFRESLKFQEDVKQKVNESHQDLLFVEGDYDIRYLNKAADLLEKADILSHFKLIDAVGYGNIDKVANSLNSKIVEAFPQKVVLLYDCDTNRKHSVNGKVFKRTIPLQLNNPIEKGIENLFSKSILDNAIAYKTDFIDITESYKKKVRGVLQQMPEKWEVNKDEKGNLCTWICDNGTLEDFQHFKTVFDILEEIKNG